MRKYLLTILMLAIVASMSFALEVGGSTAVGTAGNADEQKLEVDQEIDIDAGALHFDVNGGFDYTFHDKGKAWDYEIGAKYTMGILTIGSSLAGSKDVNFDAVKAYADVVYESVGADVDFLFSANPDKVFFQGAEFSGFFNPGSLELRIGYMLTPDDGEAVDANTPEALTGGGLYAKAKISY